MKFKLKHLTVLSLLLSISSIVYGFVIKKDDLSKANKCIGAGTAGLFLVTMPLFLFKESKGKDMKDYMLTKENIKKMRDNEKKKTENQ